MIETELHALYLQREVLRMRAAERERATGEPQAALGRARPHVGELLLLRMEAPDLADLVGDRGAEEGPDRVLVSLEAGGEDDAVRRQHAPVVHLHALGRERLDVVVLDEA